MKKTFIGYPIAGHTGYSLNVPTEDGWIVTNYRTLEDLKKSRQADVSGVSE